MQREEKGWWPGIDSRTFELREEGGVGQEAGSLPAPLAITTPGVRNAGAAGTDGGS